MNRARITFSFFGYWHMGSGSGEGANLDAQVVKTAEGLPYIPGRTVKGILREGMQLATDFDLVPPGVIEQLFGSVLGGHRLETVAGSLLFSNATLGEAMEVWAKDNKGAVAELYQSIASTSIDEDGMAKADTLRRIEVTLPVELTADVTSEEDASMWLPHLRYAAAFIRSMGAHRHRGLGRVQVEVTP